jgi:hypothetical protein
MRLPVAHSIAQFVPPKWRSTDLMIVQHRSDIESTAASMYGTLYDLSPAGATAQLSQPAADGVDALFSTPLSLICTHPEIQTQFCTHTGRQLV